MKLAWRALVPISMGLAAAATLLVYFGVPAMGVVGKVFWGMVSNLAVLLVLMVV
jgi:predicted transcriptional regulator